MRFKRRITITLEGAYYLFVLAFVFAGAVMREINLMLVLAGMMLGPLIYNALMARRMTQRVTVRRRLPASATAGEPVGVELLAGSTSRRRGIRLEDTIEPSDEHGRRRRATATTLIPEIPAGDEVVGRYRLLFHRRGEYRFGPLLVRSSYPFGLVRRTVEHQINSTLVVYPRLGTLTSRWSLVLARAALGAQRQRRQSPIDGEFYGLRDWRSGDSRRNIHWRTSARRGNLMVRQFERTQNQDVVLIVDLWQPAEPTQEDADFVESAISLAATLAAHVCRRGGCQLHVWVLPGEEQTVRGSASASLERAVMACLARAEAAPGLLPVARISEALDLAPQGATSIVVSSRSDIQACRQALHAARGGHNEIPAGAICVSSRSDEFTEYFAFESSASSQADGLRPMRISIGARAPAANRRSSPIFGGSNVT
jgi:uncharacterized protein (DUF58 family)